MSSPAPKPVDRERRAFVVTGLVQGVGFRPFVHRLASELGLSGFVRNRAGEVEVEAEGSALALADFELALRARHPPLADVHDVHSARLIPRHTSGFAIEPSERGSERSPHIAPDAATCAACVRELFDPEDRRFRYPFVNCTDCGPRLTIVLGAPYDRARTTMRDFEQCPRCLAEYRDPRSRRFHAEPNACPECGPRLELIDSQSRPLTSADPLAAVVGALLAEKIVALKGIGGFHLACLAESERATSELRRRKSRDEKPFALLVENVAAARELCTLGEGEERLLESVARPIVLARRRTDAKVARAVAGDSPFLGLMLAYTPLQHLLCRDLGGAPLVMTSGNASHEPIVYEEADARARLGPLADLMLTHNRAIFVRIDDSVVRSLHGKTSTLRRARGLSPRATPLGHTLRRPLLALGGHDNATFALGRTDHALVSHHLGDLDSARTLADYLACIAHHERSFEISPELIVHDLHPDYASSSVARELAQTRGVPLLAVKHHHAHVVATMVEHGLDERVLGVAWDGSGYGDDGTIWGGEFLLCDRAASRRVAHLRAVPMPGGERAIHEPWRMALAHLRDAGIDASACELAPDARAARVVEQMLEKRLHCPLTSSAGRLFDAVSALCGVRRSTSYEGQAAIELEWAALRASADDASYDFDLVDEAAGTVVDTRPLLRAVVRELRAGVDTARVARRFHATLGRLLAELCLRLAREHEVDRVVLGGGVFANALLVEAAERRLERSGLSVYRPELYPAGDGGLSLGQLGIAAALDRGAG